MNEETETDPTRRFTKLEDDLISTSINRKVFKAIDNETAKEVVWIEYYLDISPPKLNKIALELKKLQKFEHPAILRYLSSWVEAQNQKVILITEFMSLDLKHYLLVQEMRRIKMKKSVHQSWIKQILEGLNYLHSQNPPFVHRALHSANLFVRASVGSFRIGGLECSIFHSFASPAEYPGLIVDIRVVIPYKCYFRSIWSDTS
eukprot:TRINITY_DN4314_c0_g2_i1.p1 TRINITY_DN4314_c0_g2~~TRINITY_DN4314_c0_g2_i1.p1  ORF type:complete len:203 (-),score=31.28 TRINITY_DN4314_c0_g2_i1:103-711(-)